MHHYYEILPSSHRINNLVPQWKTHVRFSVQAVIDFVGPELVMPWYARMTRPLTQCIPAVYDLTGSTVQSVVVGLVIQAPSGC